MFLKSPVLLVGNVLQLARQACSSSRIIYALYALDGILVYVSTSVPASLISVTVERNCSATGIMNTRTTSRQLRQQQPPTVNPPQSNDDYATAVNEFTREFNELAVRVVTAENEDTRVAADLHIRMADLIVAFMNKHAREIDANDEAFLRTEAVARCMQAQLLWSMELSGFGDLAISLSASRRLSDDLLNARRRIEEGRNPDGASARDDRSDPRVDTNGLYEYIPYDQLNVSLNDLPGYESQHREIVNAYYLLNDISSAGEGITIDGDRLQTGANVILYGPPGTGKTAAARAVARSLGLNLAFVNAENLLSAYRSETEKNLRAVYDKMRALVRVTGRNVVLLMDEVDGLVKNRASSSAVSSGDYSLLTRFLTILEPNDGTDNYGVFSIFTTNRLDNLDDAFKRRCATVLFGYIDDAKARARLFLAFLEDSMKTSDLAPAKLDEFVQLTTEWVPGDYVRFKREIVKPLRLREYIQAQGLTEEQFFELHTAHITNHSSSDASRRIDVPLPRLSFAVVRNEMLKYRPTTSRDKYSEYLVR